MNPKDSKFINDKKKLQVFVSSTYLDLKEERQACVETILRAGNIPAGMELFAAGNESQLEIIKRWISESDVYMLLLGGRYGAIEPKSGLSYVELEYRYAVELNKPLFAVVISETRLDEKVKEHGKGILERDNVSKYDEFKKLVLSKISRFFNNSSDIKLAIFEYFSDIQNSDLKGWIRSENISNNELLEENHKLRLQVDNLRQNTQKQIEAATQPLKKQVENFRQRQRLDFLTDNKYQESYQRYLFENTKPASPKDYKEWLDGYKKAGGKVASYKIPSSENFRIVEKDIVLMPLYATFSTKLIVKPGVKISYIGKDIGHSSIYFLENFSKEGHGDPYDVE